MPDLTAAKPAEQHELRAYLQDVLGYTQQDLEIEARPLRGGLVSDCVMYVAVRYRDAAGNPMTHGLVVKQLDEETAREAQIYEALATTPAGQLLPRLFGVESRAGAGPRLYMEAIESTSTWPWHDVEFAGRVLERLAELHAREAGVLHRIVRDWDYEVELRAQAESTLAVLLAPGARARVPELRVGLPAVQRLVHRLPELRRELVERGPLPPIVIHGDLHPGNVAIRADEHTPVLFDWARARVGSPLEDVSSWLQWLGFWEPAVKRKHDSLLSRYLVARGLARTPSYAVRKAYWLACASNCLAGALRYHVTVALDETRSDHAVPHGDARRATHDCMRVMRRADAYVRAHQAAGAESGCSSESNETKLGD